jgi:O-antigen ligase
VYSLVSALWAPAPQTTIDIVSRYALNTVLLATVFGASRSRQALRWMAAAVAAGGAMTVVILLVTGTSLETTRLSNSTVDANELAMSLIVSVLFSCYLTVYARGGCARLGFAALIVVNFYGLMVTNSRGGLTAMVCALLTWVIVGGRWRGRLALGAVIALAAGFAYVAVAAPAEQRDRIYEVLGICSQPLDRSGTGRTDIWTVGVRAFKDRPLEGFGYANFREVTPHYLLREPGLVRNTDFILKPLVAHNTYLQSLVEVGIAGSILFFAPVLGALIAFLVAARRFMRSGDDELEFFARMGFAALVGVLVASFFISAALVKILWILIGLSFGLCDLNRARIARSSRR